jgi:hypothetical protein
MLIQDICNELYAMNCYMHYFCTSKEDLKDYEEKLLDKCFDKEYTYPQLGETQCCYEPPLPHFSTYIKNTGDM